MSLIIDSIKASIDFDCECMQIMLQLLQQEEAALLSDQFEILEELTPLKDNIVSQLQNSSEQRNELFAQIQNGSDTFTVWLDQQEHPDLVNSWSKLMELTGQSKEINATNGLLLNQLVVRNQRFLAFFKGENDSSLYGPDGLNMSKPIGSVLKG